MKTAGVYNSTDWKEKDTDALVESVLEQGARYRVSEDAFWSCEAAIGVEEGTETIALLIIEFRPHAIGGREGKIEWQNNDVKKYNFTEAHIKEILKDIKEKINEKTGNGKLTQENTEFEEIA